jgi:hypothetical protein
MNKKILMKIFNKKKKIYENKELFYKIAENFHGYRNWKIKKKS